MVKITALYINIHSHEAGQPNEWTLQNFYPHAVAGTLPVKFSAGLHPWHITADWAAEFAVLASWVKDVRLLAIGECGLDKLSTADFALQQQAFVAQVKLANQFNKPLIIHCVKAYDEVLHILAAHNNQVPVVFHGFNKSYELAQSLLAKGYFLSFGKAVYKPVVAAYLSTLPISQLFLETDDDGSIEEIYTAAAHALDMSVQQLSLQLQQNVQTVFNITVS